MPVQHDKRSHPRFELLAQVQVAREAEVHIMSAQKISRGGIFVQGEPDEYPDLQVGSRVELVVFDAEHPGEQDVSLEAKIVRVEDGQRSDTQLGFGLQFTGLGSFEAGALEELLERLKGPQA
jgi:hypothetical protein